MNLFECNVQDGTRKTFCSIHFGIGRHARFVLDILFTLVPGSQRQRMHFSSAQQEVVVRKLLPFFLFAFSFILFFFFVFLFMIIYLFSYSFLACLAHVKHAKHTRATRFLLLLELFSSQILFVINFILRSSLISHTQSTHVWFLSFLQISVNISAAIPYSQSQSCISP